MRVRKCRVETCESSTDRERDRGVTFHKLPKDEVLRKKWRIQARLGEKDADKNCLVCSRHFRRVDFEPLKATSVYALKSDAVPTIFPWGVTRLEELGAKFSSLKSDPVDMNGKDAAPSDSGETPAEEPKKTSEDTKSANENGKIDDAAPKIRSEDAKTSSFVVDRNDLINILGGDEKDSSGTLPKSAPANDGEESQVPEIESIFENLFEKQNNSAEEVSNAEAETNEAIENYINSKTEPEPVAEEASEKIPKSSGLKTGTPGRPRRRSPLMQKNVVRSKVKSVKPKPKNAFEYKTETAKPDKGVLVYGSRVEVKDYSDIWYPARVVEVDHNEMEVLIHYDNWSQRFDEWIYMWSPRIRVVDPNPPANSKTVMFKEGERCFARWSNNQRFPATVSKVLSDGQYEVLFDDGFTRVTKAAMMTKFNSQSNRSSTAVVPTVTAKTTAPKNTSPSPGTPQQNHLFDPSRDHLGTKEERRNLKKKIDVKELFFARKKKKETIQIPDDALKDKGKKKKSKTEEESSKDADQKVEKNDNDNESENPAEDEPKVIGVISPVESEALLSSAMPDKSSPSIAMSDPVQASTPSDSTPPGLVKIEKDDDKIETPSKNTLIEDNARLVIKSPVSKQLEMISKSVPSNIPNASSLQFNANNTPNRTHIGHTPVKSSQELVTSPANKSISTKFAVKANEKDWCCRWVNDQPVGVPVDYDCFLGSKSGRISIEVEDHRLPPGWKKLLTKRCSINVASKWDVVLICPSGRRYRTRTEMHERLMEPDSASLEPYARGLLDFSAHRKQARRRGWDLTTPTPAPAGLIPDFNNTNSTSVNKSKKPKPIPTAQILPKMNSEISLFQGKDFVYIGSLKVQIIENLLRCPKEGCLKNFRKKNLLQMHIKHYHPEMCKFFGSTPNVADLAYARTVAEESSPPPPCRNQFKIEVDKYYDGVSSKTDVHDGSASFNQSSSWCSNNVNSSSVSNEMNADYPLEDATSLTNNLAGDGAVDTKNFPSHPMYGLSPLKITKHEVKRSHKKKSGDHHHVDETRSKKKKLNSYSEAWDSSFNSDQIDIKPNIDNLDLNSANLIDPYAVKIKEERDESNQSSTIITESGEKIKIVKMKREEIINCHCGIGEEDGLMIQCELCLCWQHALCHNIEKESDVPEKYICLICLQPYRGRKSQKYLHAQEWLYEGRLPRTSPVTSSIDIARTNNLRKSHELTANLLLLKDLMHSLRCKMEVAKEKDHPKLYLWSKPWDNDPIENADVLDNGKVGMIDKQKRNMDIDHLDDKDEKIIQMLSQMIKTDAVGDDLPGGLSLEQNLSGGSLVNGSSNGLFGNLLASPGGTALEIPIPNLELEPISKPVQISAPQPEAAIKPSECRVLLLQHLKKMHNAIEARLDSIEAQIVELESQDAPFEEEESLTQFPRTKETIQMILRDLRTLQQLGTIS